MSAKSLTTSPSLLSLYAEGTCSLAREAENAASSEAFALRAVARVRRRAALLSATSF